MGMVDSPATMPDIFGLPEHRVKEAYMEMDGRDIRMAFGRKCFGHVEWLYTVVMPPDELMDMCDRLQSFAAEVLRINSLHRESERRDCH